MFNCSPLRLGWYGCCFQLTLELAVCRWKFRKYQIAPLQKMRTLRRDLLQRLACHFQEEYDKPGACEDYTH